MPTYDTFDLAIEKQTDGYRVHVLNSSGGQATAKFVLGLTDDEINTLLDQMGHRKLRGADNTRTAAAKAFGKKLFDALFADAVRGRWEAALALAESQQKGLRLHLRLTDVPELADLPWEFLYDSATHRFFQLSAQTPLIRFLDVPNPPRSLQIQPPLRILGILSLPEDYEELAVEREWTQLHDSLKPLIENNLIQLFRLEDATTGKLQETLRKREYHVLHFIGHGELDDKTKEGALVFENERGRGRLVSGEMLGTLLRDTRSLRLVVLNACEGARQDRTDPFGGVAQRLVQQSIPAVIAMQFEISDRAARVFAHEFYAALADNFPIEAALGEARKAIFGMPNETEWATPVLYSRSPDGVLFDIQASRVEPELESESLSFDVLMQRAERLRLQGERILEDTPVERDAWLPKFQQAFDYLERAAAVRPDDVYAAYAMLQTQARLSPEDPAPARKLARRVQDLLDDTQDASEKRLLAQACLLHATLTNPPNEKLLSRAGSLFLELNDLAMAEVIRKIMKRVENPNYLVFTDLYGSPDVRFRSFETASKIESKPTIAKNTTSAADFNPVGKWNFQVRDETGSRMYVELSANGTFQMMQQIGLYQVPVNGTWIFNALTQSLAMNGVVNTFQPFTLNLTVTGKINQAFTATGADGISYVLTRA